ncbi:DUF58 domain-containing protein [Methanospirillum hungatei]|uniref:DUF58 domain-containing protein n=1 Tax=Methanospirillum hungatei TaxID=2203 RepID=UPI002B512581|nr:DUF58 domain-containing protein [Methanospirillum hungatei]HOW05350.1 DUF58 domain-containing protein [Methanospirillum hungatei]
MKLTPCSTGLLAVFLILIFLAIILDDPVLLMAGTSVGLLLMGLCLQFLHTVEKTYRTISGSWKMEKSLIRQGRSNAIECTLSLEIPPGYKVRYLDTVPAMCSLESGENQTWTDIAGSQILTLSYRFIPHYHGTIYHQGGIITIQNRFFSSSLPLRPEKSSVPSVQVQPWPLFGPVEKHGSGKDLERIGPVKGYSIRQFREYLPGDDIRHVDWKISAKRGTLYIREYATPSDELPMVIVDLPDSGQQIDMQAFSRMVSSISGYVESKLAKKEPIRLIGISGPNMSDLYYEGYDMAHCLTIIRERIHPVPRTFHLFRFMMRSDMRKEIHHAALSMDRSEISGDERSYIVRVRDIRKQHIQEVKTTRFAHAMNTILMQRHFHEIILYSLCDGDMSHIREVAALAGRQSIPFRIRTPKRSDLSGMSLFSLCGEPVEVI